MRCKLVVVGNPLVSLGWKFQENIVTEGFIARSWRAEGVQLNAVLHFESCYDVQACKRGKGTTKRVAGDKNSCFWMIFL